VAKVREKRAYREGSIISGRRKGFNECLALYISSGGLDKYSRCAILIIRITQ
jgi:hypothetical protein